MTSLQLEYNPSKIDSTNNEKKEHIGLLLKFGNFEWRFRKTFSVPYRFEEGSNEEVTTSF
jgi:hypothetical protein